MRKTVAISMDDELEARIREEAARRDQPVSWMLRKIIEKALWPDRHSPSGLHPALTDDATIESGTDGSKP